MSERTHSADSGEPLVPPLALAAYIACVAGAGAIANCSVIAALLKSSKHGLLSIIIQLAIADFILGASICPELWSYNIRTWYFGSHGCVIYRGLNVLASTATSYIVMTIALHTLATVNLEEKNITRRIKRDEQDEDDEMRSSRHSLVASSDSSTPPRTMNLDYRLNTNKISVAQPSAFVWILSISLCIPEFALATAVHLDHGVIFCTVVDPDHKLYMYSMFALFNLFLPTIIMTIAATLVIIKIKSKRVMSVINNNETIALLKLSLWLIAIYIILSTPHSVMNGYSIYSTSIRGNETSLYDITQEDYTVAYTTVVLSAVYLASTVIRPILCIAILPSARKGLSCQSVATETEHV
ncbi:hypothetical protein O3G_MSEX007617 [Manduca sexta]|uniref:G-protein coupled receptors family 1 profile domain-containing protein n=1 Tax=Manduca sexta TaxID=7130 RepID=A0A922CNW8_MANSE|nr:hypothetical protein O3G_MSEX007617 [Manduca sexta]